MLIAADYWINSCCQSKTTARVSPHTLRLAPATPWCDSFIVIRNERVCWENCLWWLRRIIFNTLQVSNKQMKRTLQIITNVLACLKCMLWLPVIVFFLRSRTSPSLCFFLSLDSVLPHSFHIPPTYSLFPWKSPAGVHACVFMRWLVCVCSSRGLFSSSPWLHIACFYHDCGQLHILSLLRASKNPLRRIRKQRSVHSGLVPRSLQWGGNGISMHTVTLLVSRAEHWMNYSLICEVHRAESFFHSVAAPASLHATGSWQNVRLRHFTLFLFSVLSRSRWSRKRVDYKERERECLKCST